MVEYDYKIETLGRTFSSNAEIANKRRQENINNFKEFYPDANVPEHLRDDFNVDMALSVMCFEIQQLKMQLKGHLKNEHPYM